MLQKLKKKFKEQKGFTLIELLAVIVILGIIAAIAVPSILGIIDNSKKDAHVANAQQMISATKMAVASEQTYQTGDHYLSMALLENSNYLDPVDSPDADGYGKGTASDSTTPLDKNTISYVKVTNGKVVEVNLVTVKGGAKVRGLNKIAATGSVLSSKDIARGDVR